MQRPETTTHDAVAGRPLLTRRDAVLGAGVAVLAVSASLFRPESALATVGTMQFGNINDAGTASTGLIATTGFEVLGVSNFGTGSAVTAVAAGANGICVKAVHQVAGGTALLTSGKLRFDRSGSTSIRSGQSSVLVTVPGGLAASSQILCTMQNYAGGGVMLQYVGKVSATQFKIQLNANCKKRAYFAWMVID